MAAEVPVPIIITDETTSLELIETLAQNKIEENVLKFLIGKQVDGEKFFTNGFISATFTPEVLKEHKINPQKLIELRNRVLRASSPNTALVVVGDQRGTMKALVAALAPGDGRATPRNVTAVSAAIAAVEERFQKILCVDAKRKCIDLLERVNSIISPNVEFMLAPPMKYMGVFTRFRNVVKDIVNLALSFVPPPGDASFAINVEYWATLFRAKKNDFVTINERLNEAEKDINFGLTVATAAAAHALPNNNQQQLPVENLKVDNYTKELLVSVREWYDSHFKFELGSKGNVDWKELFVELKVLPTTNQDKKAHDHETLLNSGKPVDTTSLHQYLWTGSSISNIVLVEGAAGIGKTTFGMKLCCLQNIEGAIVIFVPLKQLLGCGRIDSISTLLSIIDCPPSVINALPTILRHNIPIDWILDGFDEVMRTDDYSVQLFLKNFLDPKTRQENIKGKYFPDLVRYCDYVILTSRENRVDTDNVTIDGVKDPMLKPDLWIVQRWKRNDIEKYINKCFRTDNETISEADVQLLVDHSLGPQMTGFHGIPLFIKLLCEAKLLDEKLDLTNIYPPFLYQKTLRNHFDRAKIRIEYILDTNPRFIRYKSKLNALYDKMLDDVTKHAFQEFLAHNENALTFSVPCDESLPLWILVMREMGVLLNDTNETKFKFQHRTFIEYLAAQYVALNPVEALPLVRFDVELDTTWLLICQLACLREKEAFFKKLLGKGLTTTFLANHVAETFLGKYHGVAQGKRRTQNREEILKLSNTHQIKLLVQIANSLPENLFMDALLSKHSKGGLFVVFTPSQFKWMTEWCGYYGAINVLKWFYEKFRFRWTVLSEQNCRYALGRALQRQSVSTVKSTIDFLVAQNVNLTVFDAIATESTVALQMALDKTDKFEDDVLLQVMNEMVCRIDSNPNLLVAMCFNTQFTEDQLSKLDAANLSPHYFFIATALQVALPEIAEIWDFGKKIFNKINVVDEMKTKPIGRIITEPQRIGKNWDERITEIFVKECIPKFGKKLCKLKNCIQDLDLSLANEFVTDDTVEIICECFPRLRSLKLSNCRNITNKSLNSLMKLELLEKLDLSNCSEISDTVALHSLLLARRETLKTVNLDGLSNIDSAYRAVAPQLIADLELSSLDFSTSPDLTDEILRMLLQFENPITSVNLHRTKITNKSLNSLMKLELLEKLDLSNCSEISDTVALHSLLLARRATLKTVNLDGLPRINSAYRAVAPQLIADLELSSLDFSTSPDLTDEILRMLLQFENPITSVNLHRTKITNKSLNSLMKLELLEKLDLSNCSEISDTVALHSLLLARRATLKTVNLDGLPRINSAYRAVAPQLIADLELSSLDFSTSPDLTDEILRMLLQFGNPITSVNLSGCKLITNVGLGHVSELPGIASVLNLPCCAFSVTWRDNSRGLDCVSPLSNITSLNLYYCEKVTDESLHQFEPDRIITKLNLYNYDKVADARMENKDFRITSLDLTGCLNITNECLQRCSGLHDITWLESCSNLIKTGTLSSVTSVNLWGCVKVESRSKRR